MAFADFFNREFLALYVQEGKKFSKFWAQGDFVTPLVFYTRCCASKIMKTIPVSGLKFSNTNIFKHILYPLDRKANNGRMLYYIFLNCVAFLENNPIRGEVRYPRTGFTAIRHPFQSLKKSLPNQSLIFWEYVGRAA